MQNTERTKERMVLLFIFSYAELRHNTIVSKLVTPRVGNFTDFKT